MGIVYGIVVCWMPNEVCYVWNNRLMWGKFHFYGILRLSKWIIKGKKKVKLRHAWSYDEKYVVKFT